MMVSAVLVQQAPRLEGINTRCLPHDSWMGRDRAAEGYFAIKLQ